MDEWISGRWSGASQTVIKATAPRPLSRSTTQLLHQGAGNARKTKPEVSLYSWNSIPERTFSPFPSSISRYRALCTHAYSVLVASNDNFIGGIFT